MPFSPSPSSRSAQEVQQDLLDVPTIAWFVAVRDARMGRILEGLDQGVSVNARKHGLYGLEHALFSLMDHTDTTVLDLLVERGIDPTVRNGQGMTALHQMAGMGNAIVVRRLLEHGMPVNDRDDRQRTALVWAATNHHLNVVIALLDHGADLSLADRQAHTPLMLAHHHGDTAMVAALEQRLLAQDTCLETPAMGRTFPRPRL